MSNNPKTKDDNHAEEQAKAQLESVIELVKAMQDAIGKGFDYDDEREAIEQDALSVDVRSGWQSVGATFEPSEYRILLCTGGPAVQIVGELNSYKEPESARIQYQDWFIPWSDLLLNEEEEQTVLEYARVFYFGE